MTQIHVETPSVPLIKIKHGDNSDKDSVKLKLHRDPTSSSSDIYEFKTNLFYNGDLEEFLLFVLNFNMTLEASETMVTGTNIEYLCTLVRVEA